MQERGPASYRSITTSNATTDLAPSPFQWPDPSLPAPLLKGGVEVSGEGDRRALQQAKLICQWDAAMISAVEQNHPPSAQEWSLGGTIVQSRSRPGILLGGGGGQVRGVFLHIPVSHQSGGVPEDNLQDAFKNTPFASTKYRSPACNC